MSLLAKQVDFEGFVLGYRVLPDRRELVGADERPCSDHGLMFGREASRKHDCRDVGMLSPAPEKRVWGVFPADDEVYLGRARA